MITVPYDRLNALSDGQLDAEMAYLSRIIYVVLDKSGHATYLSLTPVAGAVAHNVVGNVPWVVALAATAPEDDKLADLLERAIGPQLEGVDVRRALQNAARRVPLSAIHTTDAIHSGPNRVIRGVLDRLELWARLNHPNVNAVLWPFHAGLREYLLLTCFDLIGQHPDWMRFDEWLRQTSEHVRHERGALDLPAGTPPVEAARLLLDHYNRLYSVRSAFNRFIDVVLPAEQRRLLLDSIVLSVVPLARNSATRHELATDAKKKAFLFAIRNDFTHRALSRTFLEDHPQDRERWHPENTVRHMGTLIEKNRRTDWGVRNWPDVLERTVVSGLANYVKALAEEAA